VTSEDRNWLSIKVEVIGDGLTARRQQRTPEPEQADATGSQKLQHSMGRENALNVSPRQQLRYPG